MQTYDLIDSPDLRLSLEERSSDTRLLIAFRYHDGDKIGHRDQAATRAARAYGFNVAFIDYRPGHGTEEDHAALRRFFENLHIRFDDVTIMADGSAVPLSLRYSRLLVKPRLILTSARPQTRVPPKVDPGSTLILFDPRKPRTRLPAIEGPQVERAAMRGSFGRTEDLDGSLKLHRHIIAAMHLQVPRAERLELLRDYRRKARNIRFMARTLFDATLNRHSGAAAAYLDKMRHTNAPDHVIAKLQDRLDARFAAEWQAKGIEEVDMLDFQSLRA